MFSKIHSAIFISASVLFLGLCLYATSPYHENEFRKEKELEAQKEIEHINSKAIVNVNPINTLDNIYISTALDAEKQYQITVSGGDKMDIYVHAGLVAAAWLQAKDEGNYKKWKAIENKHKKDVGL